MFSKSCFCSLVFSAWISSFPERAPAYPTNALRLGTRLPSSLGKEHEGSTTWWCRSGRRSLCPPRPGSSRHHPSTAAAHAATTLPTDLRAVDTVVFPPSPQVSRREDWVSGTWSRDLIRLQLPRSGGSVNIRCQSTLHKFKFKRLQCRPRCHSPTLCSFFPAHLSLGPRQLIKTGCCFLSTSVIKLGTT